MKRLLLAVFVIAAYATPGMADTMVVNYKWDTDQYVYIQFMRNDGGGGFTYFWDDHISSPCASKTFNMTDLPITYTPNTGLAVKDGRNGGVTFTIENFETWPSVDFRASPYPWECPYVVPFPTFTPTTVEVTAWLNGVQVTHTSRYFGQFVHLDQSRTLVASFPSHPRVEWEYGSWGYEQKVLLHNYRPSDPDPSGLEGYYSPYQIPKPTTERAVMSLPALLHEDGVLLSRDAWFRIKDPASRAPYENALAGFIGDNVPAQAGDSDEDADARLFLVNPDGTRTYEVNGVLHATSNHGNITGRLEIFLEAPRKYAGQNFSVQASLDSSFVCTPETRCPTSVYMTTWRRIHLEQDQMFRAGALLRDVAGGGPTTSVVIPVVDRSPFNAARSNRPIGVRFIHAPKLDGSGPQDFYYEDRQVIGASGRGAAQFITIDQPLSKTYGVEVVQIGGRSVVLRDGVGILSEGFFEVDTSYVKTALQEAFTEVVEVSGATNSGYLPPYGSFATEEEEVGVLGKWCDSCVSDTGGPRLLRPNHILIAATNRAANGYVGQTKTPLVGVIRPYSVVYVGAIEVAKANTNLQYNACPGSAVTWASETAAHEAGHLFDVDSPIPPGHCAKMDWTNGNVCAMYREPVEPASATCARMDGVFMFHEWADPACEYRTIRTRKEPIY